MGQQSVGAKQEPANLADATECVPRRLMNTALWVALILLGGLGWNSYESYRTSRSLSQRLLKLQELRGIMLHSDEVLTMSAAMAAATGDERWEQRYHAYEPILQDAIEQAQALVVQTPDAAPAGATDTAKISLGQMDAQVQQLMRAISPEDVQPIFPGETYGALKRFYTDGMKDIAEHLQTSSKHTLEVSGVHSLRHVLFLLGLFVVLAGAWFYTLRTLRKMQERLSACTEELARANEDRDRFLSGMSHAIRSPLTSVLGYADLLLDSEPSAEERSQYLEIIRRNGQDVLTILGDLLDLSQLKAGQVSFELIEISPFEIIDEVVRFTRDQAIERSLGFGVEYEGRIPARIKTDLERVRQVLVTLVSNAIQFTESGGVRIVTRLVDANESEGRLLEFTVIDTGVGMTQPQARSVFDAFSRSRRIDRRTGEGTGLGLAISRELARRLGGDLQVESTLGHGTRFIFTIDVGSLEGIELVEGPPVIRLSGHGAVAEELEALTGLRGRVLIAEDTPDVRLWLRSVLRKAGLEVEVAENGEVACEKAIAAREVEDSFDVILMDMQMPVLSGYEATRQLREQGYEGAIIAITSHAMQGDREMCLAAGCDAYAVKPIDRQDLLARISEYLKPSENE
jgi:signal transduction histidine kinase/CheY-like chemotaxis protein